MKTAQQIAAQYDAHDAVHVAKDQAIGIDKIFSGAGYTKYKFSDNSVLIQSGFAQYALDCDDAESIKRYSEWLANDAWLEANEIDRLLSCIG